MSLITDFVNLFQTFFQLGKLCNLRSLSLEHGGEIPDVGLGEALLNMTK